MVCLCNRNHIQSTLADEFLADLDLLEEEDNQEKEQQSNEANMQIEDLSEGNEEESDAEKEEAGVAAFRFFT